MSAAPTPREMVERLIERLGSSAAVGARVGRTSQAVARWATGAVPPSARSVGCIKRLYSIEFAVGPADLGGVPAARPGDPVPPETAHDLAVLRARQALQAVAHAPTLADAQAFARRALRLLTQDPSGLRPPAPPPR